MHLYGDLQSLIISLAQMKRPRWSLVDVEVGGARSDCRCGWQCRLDPCMYLSGQIACVHMYTSGPIAEVCCAYHALIDDLDFLDKVD